MPENSWRELRRRKTETELYSTLDTINSFSGIKTLNSDYGCSYCKNGNTVVVTVDFGGKHISGDTVILGTLPEAFRPPIAIYARNAFDNQNGSLTIDTKGIVRIQTSTGPYDYMHATASYPSAAGF